MYYKIEILNESNNESIVFTTENGWVIESLTGLNSNQINVVATRNVGGRGGIKQNSHVNDKTISMTGRMFERKSRYTEDPYGNVTEKKHLLCNVVIVPQAPLKVIYNDMWYVDAELTDMQEVSHWNSFSSFGFSLYVPEPCFKRLNKTKTVSVGTEKMFRYPFRMEAKGQKKFYYSNRFYNLFPVITNYGTVEAPFSVNFKAVSPVLNPYVIKVPKEGTADLPKIMKVNIQLNTNDELIISRLDSLKPKCIFIDGVTGAETDVYQHYDFINSESFNLDLGKTVLSFGADENKEGLEVYFTHHDTIYAVMGNRNDVIPPKQGIQTISYNELNDLPEYNNKTIIGSMNFGYFGEREYSEVEITSAVERGIESVVNINE